MQGETILALSCGTLAMWVLILIIFKWRGEKVWKSVPVAPILTVTGTLGTYLWAWFESSAFGARSYYGAVFLVPVAFIWLSRLLKIPYKDLIDACAPAECIMLVLMKYMCLRDGCCGGRMLYVSKEGTAVVFPSQIVELTVAGIIMLVLMVLARKEVNRGKVYAWYLVIYGAVRFALSFMRESHDPFLAGLPIGSLWSVVAVFIGILWLGGYTVAIVKHQPKEEPADL